MGMPGPCEHGNHDVAGSEAEFRIIQQTENDQYALLYESNEPSGEIKLHTVFRGINLNPTNQPIL